MVILQALINMAVVTSSMPYRNYPAFYQLRRYSLVIMLSSVGILLNISHYTLDNIEDKR